MAICECTSRSIFIVTYSIIRPRNGKNIGAFDIVHALVKGYNLSYFFAAFLSFGGFFLIKQWGKISLTDLARHNRIEHDASLVHHDAEYEAEYAPCDVDDNLVDALISEARTPREGGSSLSAEDLARVRVRRERASPTLDAVHAEIARGEMAIAFGVFGGLNGAVDGIPARWLREWIQHERIPSDWKPTHTQGMQQTVKASGLIRNAMKRLNSQDVDIKEESDFVTGGTISDASSSNGDSLFNHGDAQESTPGTSDAGDDNSVYKKEESEY